VQNKACLPVPLLKKAEHTTPPSSHENVVRAMCSRQNGWSNCWTFCRCIRIAKL